ncbi:MAG: ABC transporter substrate-binding protein [Chloroflexales bacterium]|nr:ABC transporter substrate-binding protein [Chloroflexales bacterium]
MKYTTLCALFCLLLTACATTADGGMAEPTVEASTKELAADDAFTSTEPIADANGFPVTIRHDQGAITLEAPAERIVVMTEEFIELAVALEVPLVGVGAGRNQPTGDTFTQLPYLDRPILGEPVYLNARQPNMEAILALQPDLILRNGSPQGFDDEFHDSFAQVAPTLTYAAADVGGWKEALRGFAVAINRSEQAEAVIRDYDARVAELRAEMEPVVEQAPNVALLVSSIDQLVIANEQFALGGLMQTLGFTLSVPDSVEMLPMGYSQISPEILGDITADTIVVMRNLDGKEHTGDAILASLDIPVLIAEIRPGMGYAGPFAEIIYLEEFAEAFRAAYLPDSAGSE